MRHKYEIEWKLAGIVNCGSLLRSRRMAVAASLAAKGVHIPKAMSAHRLPPGPSGVWLEKLLPWREPRSENGEN